MSVRIGSLLPGLRHSPSHGTFRLVMVCLLSQLLWRTEVSYPSHTVNAWACRPEEPLVGGPQLAAETLRQRQVVGVVGGTLLELTCELHALTWRSGG